MSGKDSYAVPGPLETAEAVLAAHAAPSAPNSAYDTRWYEWAIKLAEYVKATTHRPEELTQLLGVAKPCGARYFLEGYGMVHCDQPTGHDGKHHGPLFTEHEWAEGDHA